MAVEVTPGENRSLALSTMVAGGGVALVAGLPLGRVVGLLAGWRVTFGILGVLSAILLVGLWRTLPPLPQNDNGESKLTILKEAVTSRPLLMIYLITAVIVSGNYTGYSYIEPFLDQVVRMEPQAITLTLCLFGVAGLSGSFLMSRYFSRYPRVIVTAACFTLPSMLLILLPAASLGGWAIGLVCIIWGLAFTIYNISFQNEIIVFSPHNSAVAMSIYSGIFNLGIGAGALIGGRVCDGGWMEYIGLTGGCIAMCAAVYAFFRFLPRSKF